MNRNKKIVKILLVTIVVVGSLFYLYSKGTYTSYETLTNGKITPNIARWKVNVDGFLITTEDVQTIGLSNIEWNSTNALEGKAVPGSTGVLSVLIDPSGTDVSIKYTLDIIDKNVDDSKFLEVTGIRNSTDSLVKTGESSYAGIITLDEIKKNTVVNLILDVSWPLTDEDIDPTSSAVSTSSNFLEINFSVEQYKGEKIVPYTAG